MKIIPNHSPAMAQLVAVEGAIEALEEALAPVVKADPKGWEHRLKDVARIKRRLRKSRDNLAFSELQAHLERSSNADLRSTSMNLQKLLSTAKAAGYTWGVYVECDPAYDVEIVEYGVEIKETADFANKEVDECWIEFVKDNERHGAMFWCGANGTGKDTASNFDECLTDWSYRPRFEGALSVLMNLSN